MQLFHRSDRYFAMDADGIQEHNWRRVRLMTGIYLIALAVYFFAVCLPGGNDTQTTAVLAAIAAQGIYSLLVWKKKERPESSFAENGIILFFGGMTSSEMKLKLQSLLSVYFRSHITDGGTKDTIRVTLPHFM